MNDLREEIRVLSQIRKELGAIYTRIRAMENLRSLDVLRTPISDLYFSVRARKALSQLGVSTLGDLAEKTENEIACYRNVGPTTINEIKRKIAEYGIVLG